MLFSPLSPAEPVNGHAPSLVAAAALLALAAFALVMGAAAWLWLGALAAALATVYARLGSYPLLVVAAPLAGLAAGLLLGSLAAVLVGVGLGWFVVDRLEPASARWRLALAGSLVALGGLLALVYAGVVGLIIAVLALASAALVFGLERGARGWHYAAPASSQPQPPLRLAPALADALPPTSPRASGRATVPAGASSPESEVVKNALQAREGTTASTTESTTESINAEPPTDDALYRRLAAWRKHEAASANKPAYTVLTNASLEAIARDKPRTLEALRGVKGVGPVKLERYGAALLALVREQRAEQG